MARHKDVEWNPPQEWQYVPIYLLEDIRDELKRLNGTMSAVGCIHTTMKGLRRDIQKARRSHRRKV